VSVKKRLDAIRAVFDTNKDICPGCGVPVGLYVTEGVHICEREPERCPTCERALDEQGRGLLVMLIVVLPERDAEGNEDQEATEFDAKPTGCPVWHGGGLALGFRSIRPVRSFSESN
jgi:RNA polymerase subunit RPABC4/transcription elongation factor Spt4